MFSQTCVKNSVHGGGGVLACGSGGCLPVGLEGVCLGGGWGCTHPGRHPPRQTPPPVPRWPLQRTVRILLECILVFRNFLGDISHFCGATDTPVLDFW